MVVFSIVPCRSVLSPALYNRRLNSVGYSSRHVLSLFSLLGLAKSSTRIISGEWILCYSWSTMEFKNKYTNYGFKVIIAYAAGQYSWAGSVGETFIPPGYLPP